MRAPLMASVVTSITASSHVLVLVRLARLQALSKHRDEQCGDAGSDRGGGQFHAGGFHVLSKFEDGVSSENGDAADQQNPADSPGGFTGIVHYETNLSLSFQ